MLFSNKRNVFEFTQDMDPSFIQKTIDDVYVKTEHGQFIKDRFLFVFYPGKYNVEIKLGYYTEVIGLGENVEDVEVEKLTCSAKYKDHYNALCNFWRSISNLTIRSTAIFAVSQATSMRRVHIKNDLYLHDHLSSGSGGFIANCLIDGKIYSGPQQQWLTRNTTFQAFPEYNWNMVFVGCSNNPQQGWPEYKYTVIDKTPIVQEKPFICYKDRHFYLALGKVKENTIGPEFNQYERISMDTFYVVSPEDTAKQINQQLAGKKNILFLPGQYVLEEPLYVQHKHTILMGLGFATLTLSDENKESCIISNAHSIIISNLLMDANQSKHLLWVKKSEERTNIPTLLCDLYFRVGGVEDKKTHCEQTFVIEDDQVIGDHFWLWRADHSYGVGWDINTTKNGLIIQGDDFTGYGIMVEHFHEYQTIFAGERARIYMYQSESPYEVPSQDVYRSHDGQVNGYASYKVMDHVQEHTGIGIGVYSVFFKTTIDIHSAIEAPANKGIYFKNLIVKELGPYKGVSHVINDLVVVDEKKREKIVLEFSRE